MPYPDPSVYTVQTTDDIKICFDHYAAGHERAVVIVHGFFNSRRAVLFRKMAEALSREFDVIVMDMRGHGESSGLFTWSAKEHEDVLAVLRWARPRYKMLGVLGFSLGAAASIVAASQSEMIDSLVAVSAPVSFGSIDFHFWRSDALENTAYLLSPDGRIGKGVRPGPFWLKKTAPRDAIKRVKCPLLLIAGGQDWLIAPRHARELFSLIQSQRDLYIIEKGTHAEYLFRSFPEEFMGRVGGWFE